MKLTLTPPAKRRRGPNLAVIALIGFSLFVPLSFLFDFAPTGYWNVERPHQETRFTVVDRVDVIPGTTVVEHSTNRSGDVPVHSSGIKKPEKTAVLKLAPPKPVPAQDTKVGTKDQKKERPKGLTGDENDLACQLEFGSYCLWAIEHKEVMKDHNIKRLKDQLFVSRAYYPTIAKLQGQEDLARELKQNIQEHEKILSESIVDADLPNFISKRIERMEQVTAKAKACNVDCNSVDRKLRQILDMTEDETHFHMKQSAFLYKLGVHTMPKSQHCLSMRLTVEYFGASPSEREETNEDRFDDPRYHHYVIFSTNIFAASVVVNSTVRSSRIPRNIVFHVLTDGQNFYAMKMWFLRNSHKDVAIEVINYEDITVESLPMSSPQQLYMPEEFRILIRNSERPTDKARMEYLSSFSHSHFFLPEVFKDLRKVILLEDDVVVQGDLSALWDLDMGEKVIGSVQLCELRLAHLRNYLHESLDNPESCAWMSGLNLVNFDKWRKYKLTEKYLASLKQFQDKDEASFRAEALPLSMLIFHNRIYPLDERWILSGLGYDYKIDQGIASSAVALHYNGNMKPWMELGIPGYKKYWKRFLTQDERFLDDCNVHL